MTADFRYRLMHGERLTGTIVTLPCPQIAEQLAGCGFDWLFIDGEHGPLSIGDIHLLLQAAQPRCACLVRLAATDEVHIKQALDAGADGIIAPLVNDADTAKRVVALSKYPPLGTRSVGIGRAHAYGQAFTEYVDGANERLAVVVQVEHVDAVANIDAIVDVPGIDGVFVGPYDLSASMGKPGRVDDPDVQAHIETVRRACLQRQIATGIFGRNAAALRPHQENGFTLLAVGMDTLLLGQSARDELTAIQAGNPYRQSAAATAAPSSKARRS